MPPWKLELDAIVGARHGGQAAALAGRLVDLDRRYPNIPDIVYQLAWTQEMLGHTPDSIAHYERAISLGLSPNELSAALIGLGNGLRASGQIARAVEVLESGRRQFPSYREFEVFLALALHSAGRHAEAMRLLLVVIADSAEDPGLTAYQRAIRFHASKL